MTRGKRVASRLHRRGVTNEKTRIEPEVERYPTASRKRARRDSRVADTRAGEFKTPTTLISKSAGIMFAPCCRRRRAPARRKEEFRELERPRRSFALCFRRPLSPIFLPRGKLDLAKCIFRVARAGVLPLNIRIRFYSDSAIRLAFKVRRMKFRRKSSASASSNIAPRAAVMDEHFTAGGFFVAARSTGEHLLLGSKNARLHRGAERLLGFRSRRWLDFNFNFFGQRMSRDIELLRFLARV